MSRSRFRCVVLLLFPVLTWGAPREAEAQIGKLKKAIAGKAVDAGKTAACIPERPPTYVETIALTAAQMAQINAGLDAEIARGPVVQQEYEQRRKDQEQATQAYEKARADYDKRYAAYDKCATKVAAANATESGALRARADTATDAVQLSEGEEARLQALAARAAAAAERVAQGKGTAEDRNTLAEFQRAMAPVQANAAEASSAMQESAEFDRAADARVEKACGKKPEAPQPPATRDATPGELLQETGAKAAGMPIAAYGAARDLAIGYAMSNTVVKPGKSSPASQAEIDALNAAIQETAKKICEMKKAGIPI
ncbi:MAG TPA: hypothetical protein VFU46_13445 [Gemmatimonadales bacterium]|nr:hypothetical protein [Gemmatimonadales bacterium]